MKIRTSPSVINFQDKVEKIWNLKRWEGVDDEDKDVLFFGLYTLFDYDAFWYSDLKKRSIFWCGSDVINTLGNIEFQRRLKLYPETQHYCETQEEYDNLKSIGIESKIIPSFLEDINDFPMTYQISETPHIWMCAHPAREVEYGVDTFLRMARKFPDYTFHIYGIYDWIEEEQPKNVLYHGQIPNDQLNQEIRKYQGSFRGNEHEGFSEVPIKTILLGGYPITKMKFEKMWNYQTDEELEEHLKKLKGLLKPNEAYQYWRNKLNKFPWLGFTYQLKEVIKNL